LIIHGQHDVFVPFQQSEILYEAFVASGAAVTLILLPQGEHGQWEAFFSDPAVGNDASLRSSQDGQRHPAQRAELSWDTLVGFFTRHLRPRRDR
jgi:acetyl esterase/lipase